MRNFREIQASLNGKTARYPTRREPNIMDIESATCGLQLHMGMHDFIHLQAEETFKKSQWFTCNYKVSMADLRSLLCDCSKAKTTRIIVGSVTKPLTN